MSKTAHILCIAAGHGEGDYAPTVGYSPIQGELQKTVNGDLWIGPRARLETLRPAGETSSGMHIVDEMMKNLRKESLVDMIASFSATINGMQTAAIQYPRYIQIIPYYLFRHNGRFLRYVRTADGGENRLHGKVSIGVGGHVDAADIACAPDGSIDLAATLDGAGRREGVEELGVDIGKDAVRWVATIYAVDTEVDTVHLGIVGICEMTDDQVNALEVSKELGEHAFMTLSDVAAETAADHNKTLETWTRLVIEANPLA